LLVGTAINDFVRGPGDRADVRARSELHGSSVNFAIEIVSIERDGKYAYQTARWTLDAIKTTAK
jgi:hypothetical protein